MYYDVATTIVQTILQTNPYMYTLIVLFIYYSPAQHL